MKSNPKLWEKFGSENQEPQKNALLNNSDYEMNELREISENFPPIICVRVVTIRLFNLQLDKQAIAI